VPFVVVTACADAPPAHHSHHPHHAVAAAPTPPAPPRPPELVDELPPLEPTPSQTRSRHRQYGLEVHLLRRLADGTMVRFALGDPRTSPAWEAKIVDATPDGDSGCAIMAVGAYEVECRTALPPEAITGHVVSCSPPAALAAKILEEDCRTGVAICNPPAPSLPPRTVPPCPSPRDPGDPICNPPRPGWIAGRILKLDVLGDRVIALVEHGRDAGVEKASHCRAPGQVAPACSVIRVGTHETTVSIAATPERVRDLATIELETNPP
jgi:hypothetical protein